MKLRRWLWPAMLALTACIQQPIPEGDDNAQVKSWAKVVSIDGEAPASPYLSTIAPGPHELVIVYRTYRYDYRCRFVFDAAPGTRYEIVDHSDPMPLTLYRWVRSNGLWSVRMDPVAPLACLEEPRPG